MAPSLRRQIDFYPHCKQGYYPTQFHKPRHEERFDWRVVWNELRDRFQDFLFELKRFLGSQLLEVLHLKNLDNCLLKDDELIQHYSLTNHTLAAFLQLNYSVLIILLCCHNGNDHKPRYSEYSRLK